MAWSQGYLLWNLTHVVLIVLIDFLITAYRLLLRIDFLRRCKHPFVASPPRCTHFPVDKKWMCWFTCAKTFSVFGLLSNLVWIELLVHQPALFSLVEISIDRASFDIPLNAPKHSELQNSTVIARVRIPLSFEIVPRALCRDDMLGYSLFWLHVWSICQIPIIIIGSNLGPRSN